MSQLSHVILRNVIEKITFGNHFPLLRLVFSKTGRRWAVRTRWIIIQLPHRFQPRDSSSGGLAARRAVRERLIRSEDKCIFTAPSAHPGSIPASLAPRLGLMPGPCPHC